MSHKIIGHYDGTRFALVKGTVERDRLKTLGNFGSDIAQAARKQTKRRGPENRDICEIGGPRLEEHEALIALNLTETFFLVHGIGCVDLVCDNAQLSALSCWKKFRDFYEGSNHRIDFAVEYAVYHYLRSRGWVVKSGENYGTSFLLYQKGPNIDHAKYAVIIVCEGDDISYSWLSLLTYNRVVQGVSKELLIAFVSVPEDFESLRQDPSCIRKMTIDFHAFSSRTNHIDRITDTPSDASGKSTQKL